MLTKARMNAMTERQVSYVRPVDAKEEGFLEHLFVAGGGRIAKHDQITGTQLSAA